jgi:hypothetical protein
MNYENVQAIYTLMFQWLNTSDELDVEKFKSLERRI